MTAFPPWTPFERYQTPELPTIEPTDEIWVNSRYQVHKRQVGGTDTGAIWMLSIKRRDKEALHDWRDLQRIKNELCGPEMEAVELYPAESRLVDTANQYYLWVFAGMRFPFGFEERMIAEDPPIGAKQRPFEERPADCLGPQELMARLRAVGRIPGVD